MDTVSYSFEDCLGFTKEASFYYIVPNSHKIIKIPKYNNKLVIDYSLMKKIKIRNIFVVSRKDIIRIYILEEIFFIKINKKFKLSPILKYIVYYGTDDIYVFSKFKKNFSKNTH